MMEQPVEKVIREPEVQDAVHYRRRVHQLAASFVALFVASLVGIALIIWQGQFFVSLTQHSNIETLVLAFLLLFFAYLAFISAPGALGAVLIASYAIQARVGQDANLIERRKAARSMNRQPGLPLVSALNLMVRSEGTPKESFRIEIADEAGAVGALEFDGARLLFHSSLGNDSNSVLHYVVQQINQILGKRIGPTQLNIVNWQNLDDEGTEMYLSQVSFARNLARNLRTEDLWPSVQMTMTERQELERQLTAICPALRDEAFLPDWEYQAEHKLPLIPEPLGIISLSRSERRADPVASMGCATLVVLFLLLILTLVIAFPPWTPGA